MVAGLSSRIRRASFDHIDLLEGLLRFERPDDGVPASVPVPGHFDSPSTMRGAEVGLDRFRDEGSYVFDDRHRSTFIEEVRRAEEKFQGGYVGANYFVTRWSSEVLEDSPESRRRLLDVLVDDGRVEVYEAPDGKKAIRLTESLQGEVEESEPPPPSDSEGRNDLDEA